MKKIEVRKKNLISINIEHMISKRNLKHITGGNTGNEIAVETIELTHEGIIVDGVD